MDQKSAVEILVEIERRFDVNSLRYNGVNIWPLIRLELWKELLSESFVKPRPQNVSAGTLPYKIGIVRLIRSILSPLTGWLAKRRQNKTLNQEQADILFFSNAELHRFKLESKYYNFYMDPWIEFARKYHQCVKVEIGAETSTKTQPRVIPTIMLYGPSEAHTLRDQRHIENFEMLMETASSIMGGVKLSESALIATLEYMENYTQFFEEVLLVIKPKAVFFICFYDIINMALIRACRKNGIRTVDIQHGKQGKYHGLYTHWMRMPADGYEFLPDYFWTWGEESRSNILQRSPIESHQHLPVIGGNLWLNKWKSDDWYVTGDEEKNFHAYLDKMEKVILYSVQPIDVPFPQHLITAMRASSKNWLWLIRLHPSQKDQQADIQNFLENSGISHFEIGQATNLPLYPLLRRCDHHITCWSTVCYEALVFDVPSSIVHENGKIFYRDYIDMGLFLYADTSDELLRQINQHADISIAAEESPYIVADYTVAEQALDEIMKIDHRSI